MRIHDEDLGRHPAAKGLALTGSDLSPVQREMLELQRSAGNAAVAAALDEQPADAQPAEQQRSPVLDVVGRGGGSSLPQPIRDDMESRFGADFSGVRVHTGEQAAASAASVQAHAYTVGDEIVLGAGRTDLAGTDGQHTLAHELTHVLQQRAGAVDGTATGDGIQVSDPSDRFEQAAEANATSVLAAPPVPAPVGAAQRQVAPEEEEAPVQSMAVQRADAAEEPPQEEPAG
ncbi:hypothetical protein F4553_001302 [Allocatelliglobosispora scoriae]|uniref:eCIS core domain-containing protein n=1 Tax=Allocatelliglobosispora scoriae TaxID=643052 RepID=A0A841BLS2_9ACTN|nr:DUF4157 domain-containing protein [Allocatelliglobosispora scoriae]MBB5867923.1 hypothetical protein [Allocatelliglobosispora scoriae]